MNHELLKRVIYDQHDAIRNMTIIDRDIHLEKNANYILIGLRRAGKSTLLYKRVLDLIKDGVSWEQIIYINFDDERLIGFTSNDFDDILQTASELTNKKHYYFFDEIQNIDGWEKFSVRMANLGHKVDITGSNAKMLSKEMNAALGGRYVAYEVTPYSFKEYLVANDIHNIGYSAKDIGNVNRLLEQYLLYGGFPASLQFTNKREYISSIYQKTLYGDIIAHNGVRHENGMKLLIKKIAESVMQDISHTRLQSIISGIGYKISKDIVINYCQYCVDAFLLFTIKNYYSSFVDKNSNPKYYFSDNGLLNLFIDDKRSALLENLVGIELARRNKEHLYYLKGKKVDIDFYLSDSNTAIQVAYSINDHETYDREINNLVSFAKDSKEPSKLILITYQEEKTIEIDGFNINVIPLLKFLLEK